MRLALIVTVKNERDLLRGNLLYHAYLGVEHFFVFSDDTTDDTLETIGDLPFVEIAPSVKPERYRHRPELAAYVAQAEQHHTARQNLNTFAAMEMARAQGFDWLIALDADELICLDLDNSSSGLLNDFFAGIPEEIESVRFPTLEVVARQLDYEHVFTEEILFKQQGVKFEHPIFNPYLQEIHIVKGFFGQTMGKSALRLTVEAKPKTTHHFVSLDDENLKVMKAGYLLHYNCYSFYDFMKKYKNFKHQPDTWLSGNKIDFQRRLWRNMVNDSRFSEDDMRIYYEKWMLFPEEEVEKLKQNRKWFGLMPQRPAIIEVTAVQKAFAQIAANNS